MLRLILAVLVLVAALVTPGRSQADGQSRALSLTYLADRFGRTVSGGWGMDETGWGYRTDPNKSEFAVDGSMGTITEPAGGSSRLASLLNASLQDVDYSIRIQTDRLAAGGNQWAYLVTRRNSEHEYRGAVALTPSGAVTVQIARAISGTHGALGPEVTVPGLTHTPNQFIRVRMQVTGVNPTTLSLKAWADSQLEPADWLTTVTDSLEVVQRPGTVGLRAYVHSASTVGTVRFGVDDWVVTSVGRAPYQVWIPNVERSRTVSAR